MFTYLILATVKNTPSRVERQAPTHAAALQWAYQAFGKRNVKTCKLKNS